MHTKTDFCSLVASAELIADPAKLLIIKSLLDGEKRYKEIQAYVTVVCDATLSTRLKSLVKEGLIIRTQYNQIPPKVTYKLTHKAQSLEAVITALDAFGKEYYT